MNPEGTPVAGRPSRRGVLASFAAGTGALASAGTGVLASAGARPAAASAPASAASVASPAPGAMQLFEAADLNFNALFALGSAGRHGGEVGEVLTAVNEINAAGAGYQTFTDTFRALGDRLARQADDAGTNGRAQTRRWLSLRAAQCYAQTLYFVLGTSGRAGEQAVYRSGRGCWDTFASLCEPAAVRATVPWGGARMPVWFFRPGSSDSSDCPRPTVILTNGSDGQNIDMWSYGVPAALERGWNALVYDGPGQGQLLFVDEIPFSSRWESVIGPLIDWLYRRPEVDRTRIALTGFSMGGNLAPRAAAFEHRLAALVAMPGCLRPWDAFPADLRGIVSADKAKTNRIWNDDVVPQLSAVDRFTLQKRLEGFAPDATRAARAGELLTDFWTPAQAVIALDITAAAPRITAPTLVLDYEGEQFYAGQPGEMYGLLRAPKDYLRLTAAEGAQLHCSPMAPQRHCQVVFDWLEGVLDHPQR
ncbi:alpha/beta hydrolase [Kitasatospora sp. NPDC086791]|uniref:alpha/beta hydrolase family protein n=1 Tax=Kitasatospora sp. NPDC086791 TaxID=3155178 RepID=UPI0034289AB0